MFDTIIIGKGPAGISAAIYLKRFNFNPLVIGKDYGALETKTVIDNYFGLPHIDGKELIQKGIDQAKDLGIEVLTEEVISIEYGNPFKVITNKNEYEAKSIFIATGKSRQKLIVKNLKDYEGKGVSYCAICDGFFYRNKNIGIVGSSDFMISEFNTLKKFSQNITVFTNGEDTKLEYDNIIKSKIKSLYGENHLEGVILEDDSKVELDGLFIAVGSANAQSFAKHLGLMLDESNNIIVNNFKTNLDGIFAGGDTIGGLLQVSKASSDGANASLEIKKYLDSLKK